MDYLCALALSMTNVTMQRPILQRLLIVLLLACPLVRAQPAPESLDHAASGVAALQNWYVKDTGLWQTTNWWNAANAVTVLVQYTRLSGSSEYRPVIENTFERNRKNGFLNEFYDDEGWWALAWANAYETSRDTRYLAMAESIFADMAGGWDNTCGGGIWWKKNKKYKNAIANELFLSLSAKLARISPDPARRATYLAWAQREWDWFAASGMINGDSLVNDGLDAACRNNQRTAWSYNQGVILAGLTDLAAQNGDRRLLERARSIALAAISRLSDKNGILHDVCEPRCGADGTQFKGIFARNLAVLHSAVPDPRFRAFLHANAESVWRNHDADNRFGVVWSDASGPKDAATQVSALDVLLAATVR
jgi:predicted alpha-1,6-mannanase (GH76 family)